MAISRVTTDAIKQMQDTWAAVEAIRSEQTIAPFPKGGFTRAQYQAKYGVPLRTAVGQLDRLLASGKLKVQWCLLPASDGRISKQKVYTVK